MGVIYMSNTSTSMNTTKDSGSSSVFNFDDSVEDMTVQDDNIAAPDFGNIPPIQSQPDTLTGSATALSEAVTPFASNNPSYYDDYGPPNDGGPMTLAELEPDSDDFTQQTTQETQDTLPSLSGSDNLNTPGTTQETPETSQSSQSLSGSDDSFGSFGGSRITFGGKKVKKTALDELIKDMNRITYILKGMKVERKVMKKKSKKNKNKKNNKRTYKKIKRIPRNNRKRSVKKSKK